MSDQWNNHENDELQRELNVVVFRPGGDDDMRAFLLSQQTSIDTHVALLVGDYHEHRPTYFRKLVSIAYALADAAHSLSSEADANKVTNAAKQAIFKYKLDFENCSASEEEDSLFNKIVVLARGLLQQALDAHGGQLR
jgi:hypothetical protein